MMQVKFLSIGAMDGLALCKSKQCCCNCKKQRTIYKHPWNEGAGRGRVTEIMGYGCTASSDDSQQIIFMDRPHGRCEMHDKK